MKKEDLLKVFAQMSSEDQEAIRAELIGKGGARGVWDPMAMCQDMMEKIKASGDPWTVCREMMESMQRKCC